MKTLSSNAPIAGAGLLGRLLAWKLLQRGYSLSVYKAGDIDATPAAAATAAGMISPLSEAVISDHSAYKMGLLH